MSHDPIIVKLTPIELQLATLVGQIRTRSSKGDGMENAHGLEADLNEGLIIDILGAKGECILAKHLNVFWCGSVNTFKNERDVGAVFENRTIGELRRRLLVREGDLDEAYYVSTAVVNDIGYIKGYLLGKDAKKGKWLKDYADREPAYFIPDEYLKDPRELKDLYSTIRK
jgi:hypothetical protein